MKQGEKKLRVGRPSPAMVVALIALLVALSGSAYAGLRLRVPLNSVGGRQLKAGAVTTNKIANGAVTGGKVSPETLTGADINMAALGTVPQAANATHAQGADTVGGHAAACPAGTTLIRGICFDSSANPEAPSLKAAAEACAAKGGYLPTPMELYSVKSILNLGDGIGADHQYTDEYYANTQGEGYSTVVVDGTGAITEQPVTTPSQYYCVYPLVR